MQAIRSIYDGGTHFHQLYGATSTSQQVASDTLQDQGVILRNLDDLGNRWSKRWSHIERRKHTTFSRVLLQW